MEQNGGNQNMPSTSLCIRGCGFYGNSSFDGMCSKCHKDSIKRRQHNPSSATLLGAASGSPASLATSSSTDAKETLSETLVSKVNSQSMSEETNTTPSVETASPTVPIVKALPEKTSDNADECTTPNSNETAAVATNSSGRDSPVEKDKKPKKNRCHLCKKKVGLTGFECRCGGLYCGLHRYSDKHECTFDYKELREQIRKANPVVVGAKVQKI